MFAVKGAFIILSYLKRGEWLAKDDAWIEEVLQKARVLELGMVDRDGSSHIVPLSFGYDDGTLYVHGAPEGRKNEILNANPKVCFQILLDSEIQAYQTSLSFNKKYRSVAGYGEATILSDPDRKREAMKVFEKHRGGSHNPLANADDCNSLWLAKIDILAVKGKRYSDA